MRRLAIFGSKGYLGRQLLCYFTHQGVACDGFDVPECDIIDSVFWATFDPSKYDAILFFSGLTGTERSFGDAINFTAVNEMGLLHLLSKVSSLRGKAPRIIFPSTRLVYRGGDGLLGEDAPKEPKTVYAVNKLACEGYLSAYHNRYEIPYTIVRIGIPYGNLVDGNISYGTIGFFQKQLQENQIITLYGKGEVRRTFTHVEDLCTAIDDVAKKSVTGVFNMPGEDLSLFEVAQKMAEKHNGRVSFRSWPEDARMLESGDKVSDSSRI